jgi:ElaA protein
MDKIQWSCKHFSDLAARELHDIIKLRLTVFVTEQKCIYLDVDGLDVEAFHLVGRNARGDAIAVSRLLPFPHIYHDVTYPYARIGRVAIDKSYRGKGMGHTLMKKSLREMKTRFGDVPIILSAQYHLKDYYAAHGFKPIGDVYMEAGIPHTDMLL